MYLCLYKDIKHVGVQKLKKKVADWYSPAPKTLPHNIQVLRKIFAKWATLQIDLGSRIDWDAARPNHSFGKAVKKVNLWMDSVDFGLLGKRSISRKSGDWSYKLNGSGRRFQILMDGNTKIRLCSGPYSPKIHG